MGPVTKFEIIFDCLIGMGKKPNEKKDRLQTSQNFRLVAINFNTDSFHSLTYGCYRDSLWYNRTQ